MLDLLFWLLGLGAGLVVLDRVLLWMEGRGWIYYRRTKPGRGASTYHLLEWTSVMDPTQRQVIEIRVKEERHEDESGDPLDRSGGHPESKSVASSSLKPVDR